MIPEEPQSLALCVLGRGIERVMMKGVPTWRPTRYVEQLATTTGGHSGWRQPATLDDETAVISGSNANLLALVHYYAVLRDQGRPPGLVIFAAGRPPYLERDPDVTLTEGRIMHDAFLRRVRLASTTKIVILTQNRNTRDDIESSLELATMHGHQELTLITVAVHVPRAQEFLKHCHPHGLAVTWRSAEEILKQRYEKRPQVLASIRESIATPAYLRTAAMETEGIQALQQGSYGAARH